MKHSAAVQQELECLLQERDELMYRNKVIQQQQQQHLKIQEEAAIKKEYILSTPSPCDNIDSNDQIDLSFSSSDDDFEDAEEPDDEKIRASAVKRQEVQQSRCKTPPPPSSFFTPLKSQATQDDALARVRQKIVTVTARKWRDENISLKKQLEELVFDNEQLQLEGGDLMVALESAQTVDDELNQTRLMAGALRILKLRNNIPAKTILKAAFLQMDRNRRCENAKNTSGSTAVIQLEPRSQQIISNIFTTPKTRGVRGEETGSSAVPCTHCDRRRNQMRELLFNLNETAFDLGLRLQSLKSTSLVDKKR